MAIILDFPQRTGETRKTVSGSSDPFGTVILFTGIRVERHPEIDEPTQGPAQKRKGAHARRQRKV